MMRLRWLFLAFVFCTLCFLFQGTVLDAGEPGSVDGVWRFVAAPTPAAGATAWVEPTRRKVVQADISRLGALLDAAPNEVAGGDLDAYGDLLILPKPDGTFARFRIVDSPVLAPALAARYPDIKTYSGVGIDDPLATLRCDLTQLGFHAQVLTPNGAWYIDPMYRNDRTQYATYYKRDFAEKDPFECLCVGGVPAAFPSAAFSSGTQLRTYRLAVSCTGEYAQFFGGTLAGANAGIATTLARVNGIYETEVAVRMILVATNDNTIYLDPSTDPYTTQAMYNAQAQATIDADIGDANYDIGHLVGQGGSGGNAGAIGSVCQSGIKGRGYTTRGTPMGDPFDVDFVAHEIGHQFGGNHTWNGLAGSCGGENSVVRYEPGSGSTIMAYAGICGVDDLQPNSDPIFHSASIDQIVAYTTTGAGNGCAVTSATGNTPPVANAGADRTIPASTPFVLTASGSDGDGDTLTFLWEQLDIGPETALNTVDQGTIPLFRVFTPTTAPTRTFPRLSDLLAGNLFPGTLGEQLPSTSRTLNFRVTARDNQAGGGGIDTDEMVVTVDNTTGPFVVLSPNGSESLPVNVPVNVTWDPAGTTGGGVNTANVSIHLSLDGGLTTPITLSASTPNDGTHSVIFDCTQLSTSARVYVRAVGNVFFDVSDNDFEIADVTPPTVLCNILRTLLWPPRNGLLPVGSSYGAMDDCDPSPALSMSIYSNETAGAPPYSPDHVGLPPALRLRAERAYPGPGRFYVLVINAVDASGNRGVDCCTTIVPAVPYGSHIIALRATAAAAEAACLASPTDVAPPGTAPLTVGDPLP